MRYCELRALKIKDWVLLVSLKGNQCTRRVSVILWRTETAKFQNKYINVPFIQLTAITCNKYTDIDI